MKKKCILIGYGNWGKVLFKNLKYFFSDVKILRRNSKLDKKIMKNYKWVFISSPNKTHYRYAKFFLKNKINVFCEKPLTDKLSQAKKLVFLSKKLNTNLFISEIETFKKKRIIIKKENFIIRKKFSVCSIEEIPKNLAYHDFYLLYPYLKNLNFSIKEIKIKNRTLSFKINTKNKEFNFFYDLQSRKKIHLINNINFNTRKNYIVKMLKYMQNKKCDFETNHNKALFALKICNLLERKLKK